MDIKQLRIGNLVFNENNQIVEIVHLISDGLEDTHKPIPLTEEWLLKFGGEKLPHFNIGDSILFDIGRNRYISISSIGSGNEMIYLKEMNQDNGMECIDLVCLHNYDYDGFMMVIGK